MKVVISSPFAGKDYCLPMYQQSIEGILKYPYKEPIEFVYCVYNNSNDKGFSDKLKTWANGLGIQVIWYDDLSPHFTIENTKDYALTSNKVASNYKVLFEKLIPECDYVLNIEDDTTCEPEALDMLLDTLRRNKNAVTVVGSVYGRRLNDRYFGVPVVFAFKTQNCYPQMLGFTSKVESHRIPEREEGEEIIGSAHVALWLTKYPVLKQLGWEVASDLGVAGDISWGYRLWTQGIGTMMINWSVKAKHYFKDEDGKVDYFCFGKNGGMPLQFKDGMLVRGSPMFVNGKQVAK